MSEKTYFIDTRALFKRYTDEPGSGVVQKVFAEKASRFISQLTITELLVGIFQVAACQKQIDRR
jgi:predicted nucleic acid-binding protein